MWGRVLRADGPRLQVGVPTGGVRSASGRARVGDLVRVHDGVVVEVVPNRSDRPLEEQDWWRLLRVGPNLVVRSDLLQRVRAWFVERGFIEIEAPCLTAGPSLELHLAPIRATVRGQQRWLATSPELHLKRLLSAGFERLFYLGRAFRDHELGTHHEPEFTMLEWYRVGEGVDALQRDVTDLVSLCTERDRVWETVTVAQALDRWGSPTEDPADIVRQLVVQVEPRLAEMGAVFLTEYPAALASLARLDPDRPQISHRFEAYLDGVELANGFGELTDAREQRQRLERDLAERRATGRAELPIDERFLDALAAGLPPVSGIAVGFDRLVMSACSARRLADVIALPHETA